MERYPINSLLLFELQNNEKAPVIIGHTYYLVEHQYAWSSAIAIENGRTVTTTKNNFQLLEMEEVSNRLTDLQNQGYTPSMYTSFPSGWCHQRHQIQEEIKKYEEFDKVKDAISTQLQSLKPDALVPVGISRWSGLVTFVYGGDPWECVQFMVLFDESDKILAWRKTVSTEKDKQVGEFRTNLADFTRELNAIVTAVEKYTYVHCDEFSWVEKRELAISSTSHAIL